MDAVRRDRSDREATSRVPDHRGRGGEGLESRTVRLRMHDPRESSTS